MKIRLVGSRGKEKKVISEVAKTLDCEPVIEEISETDKSKYHIKRTPAIIIENIVISEGQELSKTELHDVMYQFIEV